MSAQDQLHNFFDADKCIQKSGVRTSDAPRTSGFGPAVNRKARDYVRLAGLACRDDKEFWRVMGDISGMSIECERDAVNILKSILGIASRTELSYNQVAQIAFVEILQRRVRNVNAKESDE